MQDVSSRPKFYLSGTTIRSRHVESRTDSGEWGLRSESVDKGAGLGGDQVEILVDERKPLLPKSLVRVSEFSVKRSPEDFYSGRASVGDIDKRFGACVLVLTCRNPENRVKMKGIKYYLQQYPFGNTAEAGDPAEAWSTLDTHEGRMYFDVSVDKASSEVKIFAFDASTRAIPALKTGRLSAVSIESVLLKLSAQLSSLWETYWQDRRPIFRDDWKKFEHEQFFKGLVVAPYKSPPVQLPMIFDDYNALPLTRPRPSRNPILATTNNQVI